MRFALIVTVIIAVAAVATAIWGRGDDAPTSDGPFLTADNFPSGYQVSRLSNTAPSGIGGTTTPAECGQVVADQAARELRSTTVGVLAVPKDETAPTFAQSIVTGGESVSDTVGVVRRCSSYRQQTDTESLDSISSILSTPAGCPRDATVIRVRTRFRSPTGDSDSTSVRAYVQGGASVGILTASLTQPEAPVPDDFCRLTSLVADRLE
ncbi:hypothetical protein ACQ7HM_10540 [Williamsia sp. MIQD14]|uniref:hypothetical protein n=1 Tax=Williamsia sp. MIQD14 TaxID=3425703 RepID=UPI003D9FE5EA